uniref:Peroxiredoxin-like 2A n=1 Tax=Angiostrongylus cantonensis TaxID=6313 RepID=A0A0K0D0A8_ANGCA
MFGYGALAALGGAILYANLPTRLTIGAVVPTASYLSTAKLIPVKDEAQVDETNAIQASSLFSKGPTMVMAVRRPGCLLCRKEAAELSSLSPIMEEAGIQMVAAVHEVKGVNEFKPYFKGDVYFDKERHFYGPNQRWLPLWMGFLRLGSYINIYKAMKAGFQGNTDGEGRLLGGEYFT